LVLIVHTFSSITDFRDTFPEARIFQSEVNYLWAVVTVEHVVIFVKIFLAHVVSDRPRWVTQMEEREKNDQKKRLKKID